MPHYVGAAVLAARALMFCALTFCAVMLCAGTGSAQNPSADQIIRSLRPTGPSDITRGIRPINPPSDSPAVPRDTGQTAMPTAMPQGPTVQSPARPAAPRPSVNLTVEFPSGSSEVTAEAASSLDELGRALTSNALAAYRFRVEGHTDTVGTRDYNQRLSERRAASVLDYLVTKWKVDRSRVKPVGMGQDQLVVPTGPNVAEVRNRRVTVVNLGT
jgi:OmpA-OmpF porin, OOP family